MLRQRRRAWKALQQKGIGKERKFVCALCHLSLSCPPSSPHHSQVHSSVAVPGPTVPFARRGLSKAVPHFSGLHGRPAQHTWGPNAQPSSTTESQSRDLQEQVLLVAIPPLGHVLGISLPAPVWTQHFRPPDATSLAGDIHDLRSLVLSVVQR